MKKSIALILAVVVVPLVALIARAMVASVAAHRQTAISLPKRGWFKQLRPTTLHQHDDLSWYPACRVYKVGSTEGTDADAK